MIYISVQLKAKFDFLTWLAFLQPTEFDLTQVVNCFQNLLLSIILETCIIYR